VVVFVLGVLCWSCGGFGFCFFSVEVVVHESRTSHVLD